MNHCKLIQALVIRHFVLVVVLPTIVWGCAGKTESIENGTTADERSNSPAAPVGRSFQAVESGNFGGLALSPDGKLIAVIDDDLGAIRVFGAAGLKQILEIPVKKPEKYVLAFMGPNEIVFQSNGLTILNVSSKQVRQIEAEYGFSEDWPPVIAPLHPSETILGVTGIGGGSVVGVNYQTGKTTLNLDPGSSEYGAFDVFNNQSKLAVELFDQEKDARVVQIWDLKKQELEKTIPIKQNKFIQRLAVSHDGTTMLISFTEKLEMWNVDSGKYVKTLEGYNSYPNDFLFLHRGALVAVPDGYFDDPWIRIIDARTGEVVENLKLQPDSGTVQQFALSADGNILACGSSKGIVTLFDVSQWSKE